MRSSSVSPESGSQDIKALLLLLRKLFSLKQEDSLFSVNFKGPVIVRSIS
jgi:hypothetical protein